MYNMSPKTRSQVAAAKNALEDEFERFIVELSARVHAMEETQSQECPRLVVATASSEFNAYYTERLAQILVTPQ